MGPESKEALRLKLATSICDFWLGPLALFSEAELKVERAGGPKTWPGSAEEKKRPGQACPAFCPLRVPVVGVAKWGQTQGGGC